MIFSGTSGIILDQRKTLPGGTYFFVAPIATGRSGELSYARAVAADWGRPAPGRIFAPALLATASPSLLFSVGTMGRILAIDYGNKRVGLAVTDPLCLIASPLETIHSKDLVAYVLAYHQREPLRAVVVGMPRTLLNEPTDVTSAVVGLLRTLRRALPELPIHELDERFTSRMAHATMLAGGLGQKARRDKATVDRISATIILQSFLESPLMREI